MRVIKLMADYECFPLWEASSEEIGNINPMDLPISNDLRIRLTRWSEIYDKTLNIDDPINSGFQTSEEELEFKKMGIKLAQELQSELGNEFIVEVAE